MNVQLVRFSPSKWILAIAWLDIFCKMFMYVSFMSVFLSASKMVKCSTVPRAFSYSVKPMYSGKLYSFEFSVIWFGLADGLF